MRRSRLVPIARCLPLGLAGFLAGCPASDEDDQGDSDSGIDTGETEDSASDLVPPDIAFENTEPATGDDLVIVVQNPDPTLVYTYRWLLNSTPVADLGADTVPAARTIKGQQWTAEVRATAAGRTSGAAVRSVTIGNTPPTAVELTVTPTEPTKSDPPVAALTMSDPDDADTLQARYRWDLPATGASHSAAALDPTKVAGGQVWTLTATPFDGEEEGAPIVQTVEIVNALPQVTAVAFTPTLPNTGSKLRVQSITGNDPDGSGALTYTIDWYVDQGAGGALVKTEPFVTPAPAGAGLDGATAFDKGDQVWVVVTANDTLEDGEPFTSDKVTIGNTPPNSGAVYAVSTIAPTEGVTAASTLTCTGSGFDDVDGDPEGWRYQWFDAGSLISGQSDSTLVAPAFGKGDVITCLALPFDGTSEGNSTVSTAVAVGNAPPVVDSITVTPQYPAIDSTLQAGAVGAFDPDGDLVRLRWKWFVEGSEVKSETATSTSLPGPFTAGDRVRVEVRPFDGTVEGLVVTQEIVIANTKPVVSSVEITPEVVYGDVNVMAEAEFFDADGQPVTGYYLWQRALGAGTFQTVQAESTSPVLDASKFSVGNRLKVRVRAYDGREYGDPLFSDEVTVANRPPTVTTPTLTTLDGGDAVTVVDTLICSATATDPDGLGAGVRYSWYLNSQPQSLVGNSFPVEGQASRGDTIFCRATPYDSTENGTPADSDPVTIGNAPPSIAGVTLSTTAPAAGESLTATPNGWFDADGDPPGYRYAWYVNDTQVSTQETLPPNQFGAGDVVYVVVTPWDGYDEGPPVTSDEAVGTNTLPRLVSFDCLPEVPTTADDIVATWEAEDDDGDELTATVVWYLNNILQSDVTGDTFPSTKTQRNDQIRCVLTVSDGQGGEVVASRTRAVVNSLPTIDSLEITPERPTVADILTCTASGWQDADGDAEDYLYSWYKVGSASPIGSGPTLEGNFSRGDEVYCTVRLLDLGFSSTGDPISTEPVLIENGLPTYDRVFINQSSAQEATVVTATAVNPQDPDQDNVEPRFEWYVDGAMVHEGDSLTGTFFDKGQEIHVVAFPNDGFDDGPPEQSDPIPVVNTAPRIDNVAIEPDPATVLDELVATYDLFDPDPADTDIDVTFDWSVNSVSVQQGASDTLAAGTATRGQTVRVRVDATDGEDDAPPAVSAPNWRIVNSPPTATDVDIAPEAVAEGATPSCNPTGWSDADGDPEGYIFRWYVNDVVRGSLKTLSATQFGRDDILYCTATPTDGVANGPMLTSDSVQVGNSPPKITSVLISGVPSPARKGSTLQATAIGASDPDNDPITLSYVWFINDTVVDGETGATLANTYFNKGDKAYVKAIVSDGGGTATATSVTLTIQNTPPTVGAVTLAPEFPLVTDAIEAQFAYDDVDAADVPSLQVWAEWYVEGVKVVGQSDTTLPAGIAEKGETVSVKVFVSDQPGGASPTQKDSGLVTIGNAVPTVGSVVIVDGTRDEGSGLVADRRQGLECLAVDVADDDAADSPVPLYEWRINGDFASSSNFLLPTAFRRGDEVVCRARATDGDTSGVWVESETVQIVNAPPYVDNLVLSTTDPNRNDSVRTDVVVVLDPDPDDVPSWTTEWYVDGAFVSTGGTLFPESFQRDQTIRAKVTPVDAFESGEPVWSDLLTVGNAPPRISGPAKILPNNQALSSIRTRDRAYASVDVEDRDGDPVTTTWSWRVNGTEVLAGDEPILDGDVYFNKGQTITLVAVSTDGEATTTSTVSVGIPVIDSAPTAPQVEFSDGYPGGGSGFITCSVIAGGRDDDNDPVTIDWEITFDGQPFGDLVDIDDFTVAINRAQVSNQVWRCSALAYNTNDVTTTSQQGLSATMQGFTDIYETCPERAARLGPSGTEQMDHDGLGNTGPFYQYCQTTVAGGGWTRVLRTTGQNDDFGQRSTSIAEIRSDNQPIVGPFVAEAFLRHDSFNELLIVQTSGGQANRYRRFVFDTPPGVSLYHILEDCSEQTRAQGDDSAFAGPSVVGHTSSYSAMAVDGTLQYFDAAGTAHDIDYLSLCGVSLSDDNDVSYLAFHTEPLDSNSYGDGWRGTNQAGTLWSFANGNYAGPLDTHIGSQGLQTLAGWRGDPSNPTQALKHGGTYEIYVREAPASGDTDTGN